MLTVRPRPAAERATNVAEGVAATASVVARRTVAGVPWILLAIAAQRIFAYATTFVLARLLDPEQFGLVSFAMVFIGAASILEDLGVPAALIYGKHDIQRVGGTALTLNIASATLLFVVIASASPILAQIGGHPTIGPVLIALSLGIVILSLASVQSALLVKDLAFRRKFVPDVVPAMISAIVSISLAVLRFGVWSLVIGNLATAVSTTLVLWRMSTVRLRPEFKLPVARELLGYGWHVSASAIATFLVNNVDYFVVGHALGMASLGIYTLAFNVANIGTNLLSRQVSVLQFSALSRLRDQPSSQYRLFADFLSVISLAAVPIAIATFVCFPDYSRVLLGAKWANIGEPLRILVVFGVLRAVTVQFQPIYKAVGRPDLAWKLTVLRLVVVAPLLLWSSQYGLVAVAIAETAVAAVFFPIALMPIARALGVSMARMAQPLWPHLVGTATAGVLVIAAYATPSVYLKAGPLVGSAVLAALAIGAYVGTVLIMDSRMVVLLRQAVFALLAKRHRLIAESSARA